MGSEGRITDNVVVFKTCPICRQVFIRSKDNRLSENYFINYCGSTVECCCKECKEKGEYEARSIQQSRERF